MEGYSDNTLYYSRENETYWERRDSQDIKNEDGEVIGKEYYIDIYSDYTYDKEKGKYIGTGEKKTLKGEQYKGKAAREYILKFG